MTFALSTRRNVSRCSGVSRGRWGRNAGVVATALLVDVELCDVAQEAICVLIDGDLSFSDVGVDLTFARSTQNHCWKQATSGTQLLRFYVLTGPTQM